MTIREATLADVPQLVEMGRAFRLAVYDGSVEDNPEQMAETAAMFVASPTCVIFVSEGVGGELSGMLGLVWHRHFISGAATVSEAFWWSEAPGAGMRLLKRGQQWARERGATRFQMVQPASNARLGTFYEGLGFALIEHGWELTLTANEAAA